MGLAIGGAGLSLLGLLRLGGLALSLDLGLGDKILPSEQDDQGQDDCQDRVAVVSHSRRSSLRVGTV